MSSSEQITSQLEHALRQHQAGDLDPAESAYNTILQQQPDHADALYLLGTLLLQRGKFDAAIPLLQRAIAARPVHCEALNSLGVALLNKEEVQASIDIFNKVLTLKPVHAMALGNLGKALYRLGKFEAAIQHYQNAMRLRPDYPEFYKDMGIALLELKRDEEALNSLKQAIQLNPQDTKAVELVNNISAKVHNSLSNQSNRNIKTAINKKTKPGSAGKLVRRGQKHHLAGELDKAFDFYQQALEVSPRHAEALFGSATIISQQDNDHEAIALYKRALSIRETHPESHHNIALAYLRQNNLEQAIRHLHRAVALNPNYADAHLNLGHALIKNKEIDTAIICLQRALKLKPKNPIAHSNLCDALEKKGRPEQARKHCEKAIELNPKSAAAFNNLGNTLKALELYEEAESALLQAIQLRPDYAHALFNLGVLNQHKPIPDYDAAQHYYEQSLNMDPENAEAHWNLAHIYLAKGELAKAWVEYDWRFQSEHVAKREFPYPLWNGTALDGKTILVYAEQGVGDEIMFASCYPEIIRQAGHCIIDCDARLIELFQRSFPGAHWHGDDIHNSKRNSQLQWLEDLPSVDIQITAGSLPRYSRHDFSHFPDRPAYLQADPEKIKQWRKHYSEIGPGLKIGISWRGGKSAEHQAKRSISLTQWLPILSLPGTQFINLQYGDCKEDLGQLSERHGITIHDWDDAEPLKDLDSFAAQITALDLVISIDNSTVHMAGALGKPTWVMLPHSPESRWLFEREDSPWYPSLRLFRQSEKQDWEEVIERVVHTLAQKKHLIARL